MPVIAPPPAYMTHTGDAVRASQLTQQEADDEHVPAEPVLLPLQPAKLALYRMVADQV